MLSNPPELKQFFQARGPLTGQADRRSYQWDREPFGNVQNDTRAPFEPLMGKVGSNGPRTRLTGAPGITRPRGSERARGR
jgi:hypothetical protein